MDSINISCPHCLATNRLPQSRLQENPICGRCKSTLFNGKVIELNSENTASLLRNNQTPILVDCWAPWCGPCQGFAPVFQQAALELEPNLRLAKLNTEDNQALASQWQIRSIPTLILFNNNREQTRISGAMSLPQIRQWLLQQGIR